MPDRPHLALGNPVTIAQRSSAPGGPPRGLHLPSGSRQRARLGPRFEAIRLELESQRLALQATAAGIAPELVLVLEVVGSIEHFERAVRRIEGLEWLSEWQDEGIPPDEDFYLEDDHTRPLGGTAFLVLTNQSALEELLRLWRRHQRSREDRFERGLGRFKELFNLLRDVRIWGPLDRLRETGAIADWNVRLQASQPEVRAEIELWFRGTPEARAAAAGRVRSLVATAGGTVSSECQIPEIRYHALLASIPAAEARRIAASQDTELVSCSDVMFLRAMGQCAVNTSSDSERMDLSSRVQADGDALGAPTVALFDGLPMEQHDVLKNRLVIDDPDGWASRYPVAHRSHGTAMASCILHGDLGAVEPALTRKLYIRPILFPAPVAFDGEVREHVPEDQLPLDLFYRAVRRLFEGEGEVPAVAPTVRVISLSVCDAVRILDRTMSPWGRLIDLLAWKYKVLFVLSAGNHGDDLELATPRTGFDFAGMPDADLQRLALGALKEQRWKRRLLSPAEAMNALTIGALQSDASSVVPAGTRLRDPMANPALPSPISANGLGYGKCIKPDVLFPGGRVFYRERPGTAHEHATLVGARHPRGPGVRTACPGRVQGDTAETTHGCGTSYGAALASRTAARVYDALSAESLLIDGSEAVQLKTLIAHGASWGQAYSLIGEATGDSRDVTRVAGYGGVEEARCLASTDKRVTLLWAGSIGFEEAHKHAVPLPNALAGVRAWRRLIVTLGWLSPINPAHQSHRQAALWFDSINADRNQLLAERLGPEQHHYAVRRGTLQHEVLEGVRAAAFRADDQLEIQVNSRKVDSEPRAADRATRIPYALAVTLEVAEEGLIAIYNEIATRLQARVRVGAERRVPLT